MSVISLYQNPALGVLLVCLLFDHTVAHYLYSLSLQNACLCRRVASNLFRLLAHYRPETVKEKKERLLKQANAEVKVGIRFGSRILIIAPFFRSFFFPSQFFSSSFVRCITPTHRARSRTPLTSLAWLSSV